MTPQRKERLYLIARNILWMAFAASGGLLAGCVRQETEASREYLNCVYHKQYDLGLARANAEASCR